ncbi:MAG: hypothetical protein J6R83_03670 [Clostridia bacterium]|nr:hypothetical protein [Clostridia bacterium]
MWGRVFSLILSLFCVVFTIFYGADKINEDKEYVTPVEYKGVLTLWHIETFEGGSGSRKQFLLDVASGFEKQNNGILVMVITHTENSLRVALENGDKPDMISYGLGTVYIDFKELKIDKTFVGGVVNDKPYAIPWCKGGYVLFENPKYNDKKSSQQSIIVSQGIKNLPYLNLCLEQDLPSIINVYSKTPLDAYVEFVSGKHKYFLGTQRDVVRFSNRGFNVKATMLTQFNDLYQYVSITSDNLEKSLYSEKFINYLLSNEIQQKLYKINMFSQFYDNEYQIETLNSMQKITPNYTLSAFSSSQLIQDLLDKSNDYLKGDKTALSKIKNVLILP